MPDLTPYSKEKSLRVLQVASGDLWAGAEVQFYFLCQQLEASVQVELDVLLLNEGELAERLRSIGIVVTVFDESSLSFWQICRQFFGYCWRVGPDIIHSHRQKENVLAGLMRLCLRIPSIRTVHGSSEFNYGAFSVKNLISNLDGFVGRFLQRRVIAVSEDLKEKLLVNYPESHLQVVRNGLPRDFDHVDPVILYQDGVHIGIVGRLVDVKRVDIFLQMAAILASEADKSYHFWVIGDGPLRTQLELQSKQLGIDELVEFVGHIPSALPFLSALDLLVMCSDHEGTPMTLLEAWQCGLPIVAHDVGGLRELLAAGDCGCLVAQHNPDCYAAAVSRVLNSDSLKAQYIQRGRDRLLECYSAESNAQAYLAIYRQILER